MANLTNPKLIYLKGLLFLVTGLVAGGLLLAEIGSLRAAFLLTICIWSCCRAYYFAFYVIEKYVDGEFRYAGLLDFLRYLRDGEPVGDRLGNRDQI
jgi:hypothetical protein